MKAVLLSRLEHRVNIESVERSNISIARTFLSGSKFHSLQKKTEEEGHCNIAKTP